VLINNETTWLERGAPSIFEQQKTIDNHALGVQSRYKACFSKNKVFLKHVVFCLKGPNFS